MNTYIYIYTENHRKKYIENIFQHTKNYIVCNVHVVYVESFCTESSFVFDWSTSHLF